MNSTASAAAIAASRLAAHAAAQRFRSGFFKPRGIDDREIKIAKPRVAFAAVARDAGLIVDKRKPPPDQAVEQGRLADIGTADNGERKTHFENRSGGARLR